VGGGGRGDPPLGEVSKRGVAEQGVHTQDEGANCEEGGRPRGGRVIRRQEGLLRIRQPPIALILIFEVGSH
jgi:hypothetical protein